MAKAGRKRGTRHTEYVRDKIKASQLVNRMYDIAMGNVEANPVQVNAAKALLNKVLPDLKSTEIKAQLGIHSDPDDLTDEQLAAIATNGGKAAPKT